MDLVRIGARYVDPPSPPSSVRVSTRDAECGSRTREGTTVRVGSVDLELPLRRSLLVEEGRIDGGVTVLTQIAGWSGYGPC